MGSLEDRKVQVVQLVGQFKQLPAKHIHELLFADALSMNPCYNVLNQLKERKFLHRLEHRLSGGSQGGSEQYLWTLGVEGFKFLYGESSRPARTINYHTRDVADTFMDLFHLQQQGWFIIEDYAVEQECWLEVNGHHLRPDMSMTVRMPDGRITKSFIEVDRGSEGEAKVKSKLADTIYAFNHVNDADFPVWPKTKWVVPDAHRATQLRRWINHYPEADRELFRVIERANIAEMFV